MLPQILDLNALRQLYAGGAYTPMDMARDVAARMEAATDPAIFITAVAADDLLRRAKTLMSAAPRPGSLPLWGMPFAVKDNIDVAGLPTTAACPASAYTPEADAWAVARLSAAGAIVIGKTNLDQFATGLNGTRSPYGAPRCVFDSEVVSGGSSSGSAVAVAVGLCAFALGTDTAGSGRVPTAFNNIVGIKPTPGRVGTTGLVPACRSLDVISVFAPTVADGLEVRRIIEGFAPGDPFSRRFGAADLPPKPRVGILRESERAFYGDEAAARLYAATVDHVTGLGLETVAFDFAPFRDAASLLYDGPWVAERRAALGEFFAAHRQSLDPSVRQILEGAARFSAVDAFEGRYALETLRRRTDATWAAVDMLLLPTAPTIYRVAEMRADPIRLNGNLGHYTNFANLLGLSAIAVPAGFRPDGLPFGVTLVGPGDADDALGIWADRLHRAAACGSGRDRAYKVLAVEAAAADADHLPLVVVGAHLSGMPLNHQLTGLGARFVKATHTAPGYRLYKLPGSVPEKPGLVRAPGVRGPGLEVEVWSLPSAAFGRFVALIPSPLSIGRVSLADGDAPLGFLCEAHAVADAEDISSFGGWRAFVTATKGSPETDLSFRT